MRTSRHALPRVPDGWTFLYAEKCRVEREQNGLVLMNEQGRVAVPGAMLSALLLGPGSTVTHAAVALLADGGASVVWCGEDAARFYAAGMPSDRRTRNLLMQAQLWADTDEHLRVVRRMYLMRFLEDLDEELTIQQIRGREGVRVREAYARASRETGVPWHGRNYDRADWSGADNINRALSMANACLYGVCHAAIAAGGYSADLGFVHTGKALAFVYDIADLYKAEITIPAAFAAAAAGEQGLQGRVRRLCRERFHEQRILQRVLPDVQRAFGQRPDSVDLLELDQLMEQAGQLWDPAGEAYGGVNHA